MARSWVITNQFSFLCDPHSRSKYIIISMINKTSAKFRAQTYRIQQRRSSMCAIYEIIILTVKQEIRKQYRVRANPDQILSLIRNKYVLNVNNPIFETKNTKKNYICSLRTKHLGNVTLIQSLNITPQRDHEDFFFELLESCHINLPLLQII